MIPERLAFLERGGLRIAAGRGSVNSHISRPESVGRYGAPEVVTGRDVCSALPVCNGDKFAMALTYGILQLLK